MGTKEGWIKRKKRYGNTGFRNMELRNKRASQTMKKLGFKPPVRNSPHSQKTKDKIGKSNTGKKASLETIEKMKNSWTTNKRKLYSNRMKETRKTMILPVKDTSIEVKIQNFLRELKMEFFTHQYMKIKHGYQCDILIPSLNLVIECDGDYWHKYPTGREIDKIRNMELEEKGFKVLRLWENEIKIIKLNDFKKKIKEFGI